MNRPVPSFAWRLSAGLALAASLALSGCAQLPSASSGPGCDGPQLACTVQGVVRGEVENGVLAFKGIPYAQPPVGVLRWQPPAPPRPWDGVRPGGQFGAVCPQLAGQEVIGQEDCLTLNVWRPLQRGAQALPVMVFLTGGGNHAFSGQGAGGFGGVNYNGHALVPEGVVYVSFNNRLGALGFLAHPGLSAERRERVSGNYASLDQVAMLRWLRANIAAFGGDPKRVFLFGTSAGGGNLCALMTAPAARGLFHGVALQSSVPTGCEMQTLAEAEQGTGRQVAQRLGCTEPATAAACLRGQSMADVVRAVPGTFGVLPRLYGPNVDGHVFPQQPLAVIARGDHHKMPVIVGNSSNETFQFVNAVGPVTDDASFDAALVRLFGAPAAPAIRAAYPPARFGSPRAALVQATTDALFTCQSRRVAQTLAARQSQPVYRYLFTHSLGNDPQQKALGAVHTVEHPFFFPWQGSYRPDEADLAVQRLLIGHWTRLARSGTLDGAPSAWPAVTNGDAYLRVAAQPAVERGGENAQCTLWDSIKLPWPHL